MITDAKPMGCGGCGHHTFEIFLTPARCLVIECCQCKSTTIAAPPIMPPIELLWGEGSSGRLSVMPR